MGRKNTLAYGNSGIVNEIEAHDIQWKHCCVAIEIGHHKTMINTSMMTTTIHEM